MNLIKTFWDAFKPAFWKALKAQLGGRPMTFIRPEFVDVVDGIQVNRYKTDDGREFLANYSWSLSRVEVKTIGDADGTH